ncbi:hypothetical protein VCB98_10365 [Gammaproteobacteria bacterium AB-CW1]|uniref:Lipoprotein n=1 Tax=Natronospira elongata TaxID=3110268 RepID=A0AAP6JFT1_9GAMM|nr:hypothetical protein [Gammaproteobacteria bacterium AB-CW1]
MVKITTGRTLAGMLIAMGLFITGCAHNGMTDPERQSAYAEPKRQSEYFRCVGGSAIPRFTPGGNVPEELQVPRVGGCRYR